MPAWQSGRKMRIIAGRLGGRIFDSPKTATTHPMGDKVRGALFNILGDIEGLTVLDPFAGTGALAFEALSRGASAALLIEQDVAAQRTIRANITTLQLDPMASLAGTSINSWLITHAEMRFDLVLCDPPYDNLQPEVLQTLSKMKSDNGIFVLSWPVGQSEPEFVGLQKIAHRSYGDAQLLFYS